MDYLVDVKKVYRKNISRFSRPKGCLKQDIRVLEKEIGFPLPEAYKQFLLWMGCDYKGVFIGTDCFLRDAVKNTEYLPDLLTENKLNFQLSEHYLAFYSHQGYVMAWFDLPKESEDPSVWFWGEGQGLDIPIKKKSFTDFLKEQIEQYG